MAKFLRFGSVLVCLVLGFSLVMPAGVTANDPFVQGFIKNTNDGCVQWQDDSVQLFANPSVVKIALQLAGAGLCGTGVALCYKDTDTQGNKYSLMISLGILAITLGIFSVDNLSKKLSSTPYVTLNNEGLLLWGEKKFDWLALKAIQIDHFKQGVWDGYEYVSFKDQYAATIAVVYDYSLPVTISEFIKLVEHYCKTQTGVTLEIK